MKKHDFKKLAILGIVSGTVLSAQANAASTVDAGSSGTILAMGCGGGSGGGCHGAPRPASCNAAPRYDESGVHQQMGQYSAGCGGSSQPSYRSGRPSSGCGGSQQISSGCGSSPRGGYTADATPVMNNGMPTSSCGGAQRPSGPQGGCGGAPRPMQNGQMQQGAPMMQGQQPGAPMMPGAPVPAPVQPGQSAGYNQSSRQQSGRWVSDAGRQQNDTNVMSEEEKAVMRRNNGTMPSNGNGAPRMQAIPKN